MVSCRFRPEVTEAITLFLNQEQAFLRAAAQRRSDDVYSVLSCAMFAYEGMPTTIWLDHPILRQLVDLKVDWEVTGYPCAEPEEP